MFVLVAKLTAFLTLIWTAHAALAGRNPRWRVALWRGMTLGAAAVSALAWAPPIVPLRLARAASPVAIGAVDFAETITVTPPALTFPDAPGPGPLRASRPESPSAVDRAAEAKAVHVTPGTLHPPEPLGAPTVQQPSGQGRFGVLPLFVWAVGVVFLCFRYLRDARRLSGVIDRAEPASPATAEECSTLAARLGCSRPVRIVRSAEVLSPCIAAAWRPVLLLPHQPDLESNREDLRAILCHELAHVKGRDLIWNYALHATSTILWFHPLVWRAREAHAAACDAVCDAVAVGALGDVSSYARALARLALRISGHPARSYGLAMARRADVRRRIEALDHRVFRHALSRRLTVPAMLTLCLSAILIGGLGVGRAEPGAEAEEPSAKSAPAQEKGEGLDAKTVTLRGRCVDDHDGKAIPKARARLFKAQGRTAPIVEIATATSDQEGRFEFPQLAPPRAEDPVDPLIYLVFVEADDRPIGAGGIWSMQEGEKDVVEIRMLREKTTLAGKVLGEHGRPIVGATVAQWAVDGRPVPGILSATSGPDGHFEINGIPYYKWMRPGSKGSSGITFRAIHPEHPETEIEVREFPGTVTVTLLEGCRVAGTVTDGVTGRPAAGAVVLAERLGAYSVTPASTDAAGRFEMTLPEDRYTFTVRAHDRVCIATTDQECLAGEKLELPPLKLINGGFIAGRVVNASTGKPITVADGGGPIAIGLLGPSQPLGKAISPTRMATVDGTGRYKLRAAPGDNFPYFVNLRGDRMGWTTTRQPAVVVKDGETTAYDMLVTPKATPAEELKAARGVVASLPSKPADRTARILLEFRKLNHTVDEAELWCSLMRELVAVGRDAVPRLCDELDRTVEDRTLRRLGFALRAIGDPRAVPALIRALPRTLLPSASDYGLIVSDASLAEFMQKHDLRGGPQRGPYFDFGRAEREIIGTLQKLTGKSFDDPVLQGLSRSEDPRRQMLQRRLFTQQARRWQSWWGTNWRAFTDDPAYQAVNLKADDEALPPATTRLRPNACLGDGLSGATLSPATQEGEHFYDLDTGARPKWPTDIPRDEARFDQKQLADWAAKNGVDLMCVTHRAKDGTQTFVLRQFGMKAWEISRRDLRNLDKLVAAGTLPEGHAVGELLVHYDDELKQDVPDANAAFIYVTRDGSMGLIETTDRITRTADLTGSMGGPPAGVGFHKGVRFGLKSIIP